MTTAKVKMKITVRAFEFEGEGESVGELLDKFRAFVQRGVNAQLAIDSVTIHAPGATSPVKKARRR